MTLPNQPSIELPLLLELERAGGSVRPGPEFYDKVAAHFPDIQPADRELVRRNGRTKVWENTVDWARNKLRTKGNKFPVGLYIATSSFSASAQEEAEKPGSPQIFLLDGDKLVDIMLEKGLGVHTVPVTRQEISEEFFASI